MQPINLTTSNAPEVTITYIGGAFRLTGWEQNQLQAEASRAEDLSVEQVADGVKLSCRSDCTVYVPRSARVKVQEVRGDAKIKSMEGAVEIQTVNGGLVLRQTGAVSVGRVSGDVSAKRLSGGLKLGTVSGDVSVRGVGGDFEAGGVSGDLYLSQGTGQVQAQVTGDCELRLCFTPGLAYALRASGDIRMRALSGSVANFDLQARGDVSVLVPGAQVEGSSNHKVARLGQPEAESPAAQVTAQAGGDVALLGPAANAEMDDLGEDISKLADEYATQIENQIQTHMAGLERQLAERLAQVNVPLGAVDLRGEEVAARVRQTVERVSEKARRKAEAAQRKMERHAQREPGRTNWGGKVEMPARPAPPPEPVSESERLSILRMLELGKISVAEAEKLLSALEGQA